MPLVDRASRATPPSLSIILTPSAGANETHPTLDSLLEYLRTRSWRFIEILLVAGVDEPYAVQTVREYRSRANALQLVNPEKLRGAGHAIRVGIARAQGEWRLLLDANAGVAIRHIEDLYENALREQADLAIGAPAAAAPPLRHHGFTLVKASIAPAFACGSIDGPGFAAELGVIGAQRGWKVAHTALEVRSRFEPTVRDWLRIRANQLRGSYRA